MHAHNRAGGRRLGRNLESDRSTRTGHENNRAWVNERHERSHLRAVRSVFRPRAITLILAITQIFVHHCEQNFAYWQAG